MKIGIIDADLISRKKHRFPNLASMKISAYHKKLGDNVELKTDYFDLSSYDKVYISKVFTDTIIKEEILMMPNVEYGGTGFYYNKAKPLPDIIEHSMPDYHLYDIWLQRRNANLHRTEYKAYLDYSIGYLTRGCFRKCSFCVNSQYDHVIKASPLEEFYDINRKKIMLLDDNFLAYPLWKESLRELQNTNKPFVFKQGLDERILTDEKCAMLFSSKYDGRYIFSFDNIKDVDLITDKLNLIRKYSDSRLQFYVLCGFDYNDKYDMNFWKQDLYDLFERIKILNSFNCLPYIMRFNRYVDSPFRGIYVTIAQWCNNPSFFYAMSLKEFCIARQKRIKKECSDIRYMKTVLAELPDLLPYFEMKMS